MFSGIIESIGTIVDCSIKDGGLRLQLQTAIPVASPGQAGVGTSDRERIGLGDSIAINGVCLTVDGLQPPDVFSVVCGRETIDVTTFVDARAGQRVNIERALRVGDRLDGHMVQGHVDSVGSVIQMKEVGESWVLWVEVPDQLIKYIATKGSICINGVSLTVNEVQENRFRCNLIPYTIQETVLGTLRSGVSVNLEVDVVARYVERLLVVPGRITDDRLRDLGYESRWSKGGIK
jgi:riboflavin synthase